MCQIAPAPFFIMWPWQGTLALLAWLAPLVFIMVTLGLGWVVRKLVPNSRKFDRWDYAAMILYAVFPFLVLDVWAYSNAGHAWSLSQSATLVAHNCDESLTYAVNDADTHVFLTQLALLAGGLMFTLAARAINITRAIVRMNRREAMQPVQPMW